MEAINVEGNADQRSKRVAVQTRRNVGRRGAGAAGELDAGALGRWPRT